MVPPPAQSRASSRSASTAPLSHTKVFLLARSGGRDFDPSDSLVLDVVRPYFALRYEAACRVAESSVTS